MREPNGGNGHPELYLDMLSFDEKMITTGPLRMRGNATPCLTIILVTSLQV